MSSGPPPLPVAVQPLRSLSPESLVVLAVCAVLFIAACATPCLYITSTNAPPDYWVGLRILVIGWTAFFVGQFAWAANCLLLAAVMFFVLRRWMRTIVLLLLALPVAAQTFMLIGQDLPADEAGVNRMQVTAVGIGFYFWIASLVVPILGALWLRQRRTADAAKRSDGR